VRACTGGLFLSFSASVCVIILSQRSFPLRSPWAYEPIPASCPGGTFPYVIRITEGAEISHKFRLCRLDTEGAVDSGFLKRIAAPWAPSHCAVSRTCSRQVSAPERNVPSLLKLAATSRLCGAEVCRQRRNPRQRHRCIQGGLWIRPGDRSV